MHPVTSDVRLIALTETLEYAFADMMDAGVALRYGDPQTLMEFSGRLCYLSHNKPNEATRSNEDYLANILESQHYSVLEHASATFYIGGISRNLLAEITRHRHFSYSALSSRYVDPIAKDLGYVVPPGMSIDDQEELERTFKEQCDRYLAAIERSREAGIKGKKARESARAFLPGSLETRLVMSGNVRSWIEFVSKRDHPAADAEMQIVAGKIYKLLVAQFPAIFGRESRQEWDAQWSQSAPKTEAPAIHKETVTLTTQPIEVGLDYMDLTR